MIASPRRTLPLLLVATSTVLAAACAEVGNPDAPAQIAVDSLRATALILGDTLRDSLGNVAPLTAHAFDIDGDEVDDAPIRYTITNAASGIVVDSVTGVISAPTTQFAGTVRQTGVFARIGRLQTPPFQVTVVREPSAVLDDTAARVTDNVAQVSQQATLLATVVGDTTVAGTGGTPGPIPGMWVRFEPVSVPAALVDSVVLVADFTSDPPRRASWARTSASGVATQRVRVFFSADGPPATADTIDFRAILLVRGQPKDTATVRLPILTRAAAQ